MTFTRWQSHRFIDKSLNIKTQKAKMRMRRLKARYGAVENTTTVGCNAKKTNNPSVVTKGN